MPMAIRVNMFRLRLITDLTPRRKNGQPAHRMTGDPRMSSSHSVVRSPRMSRTKPSPTKGPMVSTRSGTVSTTPTQKRRLKSTSSGFGPWSSAGIPMGSSAMPHFGHSPGSSRMISGCMGQVYWLPLGSSTFCSLCAPEMKCGGSAANLTWHFDEQK